MNSLEAFSFALVVASSQGHLLIPTSIPVMVVPLSMEAIAHDTILVVDVAVGTPGWLFFDFGKPKTLFLAQRMNLTLDESLDAAFLFDSASATPKCFDVQPRHYYDAK